MKNMRGIFWDSFSHIEGGTSGRNCSERCGLKYAGGIIDGLLKERGGGSLPKLGRPLGPALYPPAPQRCTPIPRICGPFFFCGPIPLLFELG